MSSLYQGIIYNNNFPIYDILLKSNNIKISLWYLIRIYYENKKNDLYESFLLQKINNCISIENDNSFKLSYAKFSFKNNNIISTLLFMMSNDIITLSSIYKWTLEFNTIYPNNNIIIKQRMIFDTDTRIFDNNVTLNPNNFFQINNPEFFKTNKLIINQSINLNNTPKYSSDNNIESMINKKNLNDLSYLKCDTNTSLAPFKYDNYKLNRNTKTYTPNESLIDKYNNWSYENRFNKYTLNSLLLLDSKRKKI